MKKFFLLLSLLFTCITIFCQSPIYNKVGGVCFRIDDHQLAYKWRGFDSLFNKYGYKFSLGLDAQRLLPDTSAANAIREVAAHGHEIMDHSPSGKLSYINYASNQKKDTLYFYGKPGVDHINSSISRICLKIDSVVTTSVLNEGLIDIYNNIIISQQPGEFKNMNSPNFITDLYIPSKNLVVGYTNLKNGNASDPDTMQIQSYWEEALKLDTVIGVSYHKLTGYDVKMTKDALKLLVERSLYVYDSLGIPRPHTWVQPGGSFAQLTKEEVKALMGDVYGYTAGATYIGTSFKMYNEVDSLHNKRFAVQNPDINEENNYLQNLITNIADNSARHLHSFTLSHFVNPVGGWDVYLKRVDSLLAWCKFNNIPVRTVNEWAAIMFDSTPNPYANAIPELYRDINYNGIPDGYSGPFGTFDSTDGVARSKGWSISKTGSGNFFAVNIQGGVEKGWNRLSLYTKGTDTRDSVRISISFPEIAASNKFYNLGANTANWKEVSTMVYIDPRASRMTFQINALRSVSSGIVKISGVQLRRLSMIKIKTPYKQKITTDKYFSTVNTSQFVIDSAYTNTEYATTLTPGAVTTSLDNLTGNVTVLKPRMFWVGLDSVKVVASNNDNTADSGYIYFEATYPSVCAGNPITLRANPAYGSNFKWNTGSSTVTADSVTVTPTQATWYYVEYTDKLSNTVTDSIYVMADTQQPTITYVKDTLVCQNSSATFTIPDAGTVSWYDSTGTLLVENSSLQLNNIQLAKKLYIINKINSCTTKDSLTVSVRPATVLTLKKIIKSTVKNAGTAISLVVPGYTTVSILNTPVNTFSITTDSIKFMPATGYTGTDSAILLISDNKCVYDTLVFRVTVTPGISVKETYRDEIKIYPNPATAQVTISLTQPGNIIVYDMLGQQVLNKPLTSGENTLDVSTLSKGIYTLQVIAGQQVINQYLMKE